jgi:aminoglycoside phosphotransferase (APT) family kinase protein
VCDRPDWTVVRVPLRHCQAGRRLGRVAVPTEDDAARIASRFANESARRVTRFPMGLAHYVFEVLLESGRSVVVRIGVPSSSSAFAGAEYWSRTLRPLGVPLPALLQSGQHADMPYLILERLPGTDLGFVYRSLSTEQKQTLAERIVEIQRTVGELSEGRGFGYVEHPDGPFPQRSWPDVIRSSLQRSRARIARAGVFDGAWVARVERALESHRGYLNAVRPRAFLDDTTTKNVIVEAGRLSGIVDVDVVCYGDPLFTVALTRTALRSADESLEYITHWCECLHLSDDQRTALSLYTAVFCLDFMGEVGHRFNRAEAIAVDAAHAERLLGTLHTALSELS